MCIFCCLFLDFSIAFIQNIYKNWVDKLRWTPEPHIHKNFRMQINDGRVLTALQSKTFSSKGLGCCCDSLKTLNTNHILWMPLLVAKLCHHWQSNIWAWRVLSIIPKTPEILARIQMERSVLVSSKRNIRDHLWSGPLISVGIFWPNSLFHCWQTSSLP